MVRMILTILLPLLAPTLVYIFIMTLKAKWQEEDKDADYVPYYHRMPWVRLIGAGSLLLVAVIIVMGVPDYKGTDQIYVPPRVENGEVIPGHYLPAPE